MWYFVTFEPWPWPYVISLDIYLQKKLDLFDIAIAWRLYFSLTLESHEDMSTDCPNIASFSWSKGLEDKV